MGGRRLAVAETSRSMFLERASKTGVEIHGLLNGGFSSIPAQRPKPFEALSKVRRGADRDRRGDVLE